MTTANNIRVGKSETITEPVKANGQKGDAEVRVKVRPKASDKPPKKFGDAKLTQLMDYLREIKDENFTGYIKVNFSQGAIGRIERFEEILRK